jgi:CheY-like chemotaxis protein
MARILIVDDDPSVGGAIQMWLENKNYEVVFANGGVEGLNALEAHKFDLMIVDIFMPGMNGFESVRVFHQRAPEIPLIAMSGYVFREHHSNAPDFLRMALDLGAACCLHKPFTPSQLLRAIDSCLHDATLQRPKGGTTAA